MSQRDDEIDPAELIPRIEKVVQEALSRKYGIDDLEVRLDPETREWQSNHEIDFESEGPILAKAVKQVYIGRLREAERDVLYDDYEQKIGEIIVGTVQRFEGETTIINLGGNVRGVLTRAATGRGELYNLGDRIRCTVVEVKKVGSQVMVILALAS